jgi:hypothetical protein
MSGHSKWEDIKRRAGVSDSAALGAPSLLVEVERDGDFWMFTIPKWGLFGQSQKLDDVEQDARDLIGLSVGIGVVVDAYEAAADAERSRMTLEDAKRIEEKILSAERVREVAIREKDIEAESLMNDRIKTFRRMLESAIA